jgi:hypothetical protein
VIQSSSPLSIFAQTLALINGAIAVVTLLLRWYSTRCGTRRVNFRDTVTRTRAGIKDSVSVNDHSVGLLAQP